MAEIDLWERELYLKRIEVILTEYRDFVLRNAGNNLHSAEEKDQILKQTADEILQILSDQ